VLGFKVAMHYQTVHNAGREYRSQKENRAQEGDKGFIDFPPKKYLNNDKGEPD
jgi:hypothetical protein